MQSVSMTWPISRAAFNLVKFSERSYVELLEWLTNYLWLCNSWKHPLLYGAIGTLLIVLLLMLKKANF